MEIIGEFQTSLRKALSEIDKDWESKDGLIICGTHSPDLYTGQMDSILDKIKVAREEGTPFLGICFGHQLAAIEYARNVLGIEDATSEEFGKGTFVVKHMGMLNVGLHEGETYWNKYQVDLPDWEEPDNFFTTQAHPEYQSSKHNQHPLLVSFLKSCN